MKGVLQALGLAVIGLWNVIAVASVGLWATSAPRQPLSSVFGGDRLVPGASAMPSAATTR